MPLAHQKRRLLARLARALGIEEVQADVAGLRYELARAAGAADRAATKDQLEAALAEVWEANHQRTLDDTELGHRIDALLGWVGDVDGRGQQHERLLAMAQLQLDVLATTAALPLLEPPADVLVSVVVASRDRAAELPGCVASVRAQSHPRWELLVADDASTDETPRLLAELAREEPRIRHLRFDQHRGAAAARNAALDVAEGDLVVHLDDDNRLHPQWLAGVAMAFQQHPEAAAGYGARLLDGGGVGVERGPRGVPWIQHVPWDRAQMEWGNFVDLNVIAHRRGVTARFDESLLHYYDWDFFLSLTADQDPIEIPVLACTYRTSSTDRTTVARSHNDAERDRVREKHRAARA